MAVLLSNVAYAAGTRTTTTTAPGFPASTDLSATGGTVTTTTNSSTVTTEVLASGAQWSVTVQVCGPDNYTLPTGPDCANHANQLLSASSSISGSQITLNRGTITASGTPRGTATAGAETNLATPATLMTSSNEVPATLYNGVYSVPTGLTINDVSQIGTFKGYWVVTTIG